MEVFENRRRHGFYRIKWGFFDCRYRRKIKEKFSKVILGIVGPLPEAEG
jgi:hypothetical protein